MNRAEASEKIKAHCKTIALEMMNLNPTITHLNDQETQEALSFAIASGPVARDKHKSGP